MNVELFFVNRLRVLAQLSITLYAKMLYYNFMSSFNNVDTEKVLMVVKTYPTPSKKYGELVCTAGVRLRDNAWIRIYPYPFRQLKQEHQFRKYDIIEAPLERAKDDPRPDSYRLSNPSDIKLLGHIDADGKFWAERMKYIRPTIAPSVTEFKRSMLNEHKQWGASILPVPVKPRSAQFHYKNMGKEWEEKDAHKLKSIKDFVENSLFKGEEVTNYFRVLEKVPYQFRLTFEDLTGKEHNLLILDWEIPQLYFNQRTLGEEEALKKVKYKIEKQIFSEHNEVFLVLGSIHHRYKNPDSIAIDGFIYPRRDLRSSLF